MKHLTTYPCPLKKWSEKKDKKYGLKFAKAIGQDWFNGGVISGDCEYKSRFNRIRENRLYVRGEQSTEKGKKLFERQDGDLSMVNLNWEIVNVVRKFCRVVSNGIRDDYYRLDIRTSDRLSLEIKKNEREKHLKNMYSMALMQKAKEGLGVDVMPNGFVPRDEEELKIYEQLKEKPKIEIAEEILIDYIKKTNRWVNIENEKNKDLVDIGICASRVYTDSDGVKIQRIDPEYLVHSFVRENDFSDAYYYGYVDTITLGDLQRESQLQEIDLRKICKVYSAKNGFVYNRGNINDVLGWQVDVLRFAFKTTKSEVFKEVKRKGKTIKIVEKDEDFDPPKRNDYGKLESIKDTWLEGSWVIGTDFLYDYKESENVIRDEQNNALSSFVVRATDIYENRLHSFLDDIKPLADELQSIHLKIQHLRSELKPDLIHIDIDQLAEIGTDGNKEQNWQEALSILNVKGVILSKRVNMGEDGIKDSSPARPIATPQGSGLSALLNLYAHYYNQIRDVTGINTARDGSMPHDSLLGVNQMAQLASNTATQHIVDSAIDFNKRVCEVISTRLHSIFRNPNAKHLRKMYERAVGKQNIDAVEVLENRHLHDFGFTVEMIPTSQEIQDFKEDLGLYIQKGLILPEVKTEAVRISKTSIKLATQYLAYMSRRTQEEKRQEQLQMMQQKSQGDMMAAKSASEGRIQEEGIKTKMKIQFETIMSNIRVAERQALLEIEAPTRDKEFQQKAYLEKLKSITNFDVAQFKEKAKDDRLKEQSTHQSKLIDQRKNGKEPIDFSNNFDFGI